MIEIWQPRYKDNTVITRQLEQKEIEKMADIPRRIFEHEKAKEK